MNDVAKFIGTYQKKCFSLFNLAVHVNLHVLPGSNSMCVFVTIIDILTITITTHHRNNTFITIATIIKAALMIIKLIVVSRLKLVIIVL